MSIIDEIVAKFSSLTTTISDQENLLDEILTLLDSVCLTGQLEIVDSTSQMTDITKQYVLRSNSHVYEYQTSEIEGTVNEEILYQADDVKGNNKALDNNGAAVDINGYITTPYIDLLKFPVPFTLHLNGGNFIPENSDDNTKIATYDSNKNLIRCVNYNSTSTRQVLNVPMTNVSASTNNEASITFSSTPKATNGTNKDDLRYVRFSGKGDFTNVNIYATYEGLIETGEWVDSGVNYGAPQK